LNTATMLQSGFCTEIIYCHVISFHLKTPRSGEKKEVEVSKRKTNRKRTVKQTTTAAVQNRIESSTEDRITM